MQDIQINNEDGFGWTEGEGLLTELLPLYEEISVKNYQFLNLVAAINDELTMDTSHSLANLIAKESLTSAQELFLNCTGIDFEISS